MTDSSAEVSESTPLLKKIIRFASPPASPGKNQYEQLSRSRSSSHSSLRSSLSATSSTTFHDSSHSSVDPNDLPISSSSPQLEVTSASTTPTPLPSQPDKPCPLPRPRFDLDSLPDLLSPVMRGDRVIPWSDRNLGPTLESLRHGVPPWSASLEPWHAMFHPHTWRVLQGEYEVQRDHYVDLTCWRDEVGMEMTDDEFDRSWGEMVEVQRAASTIFSAFYGLHAVREKYLNRYRYLAPDWDDCRIIFESLPLEQPSDGLGPFTCPFPKHSVWPLPFPFPSHLLKPGEPLPTSLFDLSPSERERYVVPDLDPNYPHTFSPMSADVFLGKVASSGSPAKAESTLRRQVTPSELEAQRLRGSGETGGGRGMLGGVAASFVARRR